MRLLVIVCTLFTFNTWACGLNSHAEIDSCSLDSQFSTIFKRVYPSHEQVSYQEYVSGSQTNTFSFSPQQYTSQGSAILSYYEMLTMLNKPDVSVFESELATWKQEQKNIYDFKVSVESLDRFRDRMIACGYFHSNKGIFKRQIIESMDTVKRDCLASKTEEIDSKQAEAQLKEQVADDMAFAKTLELDFVISLRSGPQDTARNKRLLNKLREFRELLSLGDIDGAKEELTSIQVDADFSQASKDSLLAKINAYLGQ